MSACLFQDASGTLSSASDCGSRWAAVALGLDKRMCTTRMHLWPCRLEIDLLWLRHFPASHLIGVCLELIHSINKVCMQMTVLSFRRSMHISTGMCISGKWKMRLSKGATFRRCVTEIKDTHVCYGLSQWAFPVYLDFNWMYLVKVLVVK